MIQSWEELDTILRNLEDTNVRIKGLGTKSIKDEISTQTFVFKCIADDTALSAGDGLYTFVIPKEVNNMDLVSCGIHIFTTSSSGNPSVQLYNLTKTQDMLSTNITIDAGDYDSVDATTPAVINTSADNINEGDVIRVDCDADGTDVTGLECRLSFRMPIN